MLVQAVKGFKRFIGISDAAASGDKMITSSANQQIKRIVQLNKKAKTRYGQRVFVAEGMKMSMEAPRESIEAMYVSESFLENEEKGGMIQGYPYEVVSDSIFRTISDTQTPQGILCLVKMPEYRLEDLLGNCQPGAVGPDRKPALPAGSQAGSCQTDVDRFAGNKGRGNVASPPQKDTHLLILEGIQDPGNLGTMVRAGEGAGVTGILMDRATVDIFNPKTIRATMGSLYRVPFFIAQSLPETVRELKQKGIAMYAAHLSGSVPYCQPSYAGPTAFLIGNEGSGLSPEIAALADTLIHIPMEGNVESLNAAVAAALLMYEVKRQRG